MNPWTFFKSWRGLWSGLFAVGIWCLAPNWISSFWPDDPAIVPGSYLMTIVMWAFYFFLGDALAWILYAIHFPETDRLLDKGDLTLWFEALSPRDKIVFSFLPWLVLLAWAAYTLLIATRTLS